MDFDPTHDFWAGGGKSADELVPAVDLADLRSVLDISRSSKPNSAIGIGIFESICSPGADVHAAWYRAAMLTLLSKETNLFFRWVHDGEFDDALLKVAAKFPMKKLNVGVVHQGLPFDVEEFVKQIVEEGKV